MKREIYSDIYHAEEHLERAVSGINSQDYGAAIMDINLVRNMLKKSLERETKSRRKGDR